MALSQYDENLALLNENLRKQIANPPNYRQMLEATGYQNVPQPWTSKHPIATSLLGAGLGGLLGLAGGAGIGDVLGGIALGGLGGFGMSRGAQGQWQREQAKRKFDLYNAVVDIPERQSRLLANQMATLQAMQGLRKGQSMTQFAQNLAKIGGAPTQQLLQGVDIASPEMANVIKSIASNAATQQALAPVIGQMATLPTQAYQAGLTGGPIPKLQIPTEISPLADVSQIYSPIIQAAGQIPTQQISGMKAARDIQEYQETMKQRKSESDALQAHREKTYKLDLNKWNRVITEANIEKQDKKNLGTLAKHYNDLLHFGTIDGRKVTEKERLEYLRILQGEMIAIKPGIAKDLWPKEDKEMSPTERRSKRNIIDAINKGDTQRALELNSKHNDKYGDSIIKSKTTPMFPGWEEYKY